MTVQGPPKSANLGLAASWARHAVPPTSARPKAATRVAALVRGTVVINGKSPCTSLRMTTSSPPSPKQSRLQRTKQRLTENQEVGRKGSEVTTSSLEAFADDDQ